MCSVSFKIEDDLQKTIAFNTISNKISVLTESKHDSDFLFYKSKGKVGKVNKAIEFFSGGGGERG